VKAKSSELEAPVSVLVNTLIIATVIVISSACSTINDNEPTHSFEPFPTKNTPTKDARSDKESPSKNTRDIGLPGWAKSQNSLQVLLAKLTNDRKFASMNRKVESYVALFDPNKKDFPTFLEQEVNALIEILKVNPNYQVNLLSSADEREKENNPETIKDLIEQRAEAVKVELVTRGIDAARISINSTHQPHATKKDQSDQRLLRSVRVSLGFSG